MVEFWIIVNFLWVTFLWIHHPYLKVLAEGLKMIVHKPKMPWLKAKARIAQIKPA